MKLTEMRIECAIVWATVFGALLICSSCSYGAKYREFVVGPEVSLSEAFATAETMRNDNAEDVRVVLTLKGGEYTLSDTVRISSGGSPLGVRAAPGAKVRITGSKSIPLGWFSEVADEKVLALLPPERTSKVYVADLSPMFPAEIGQLGDTIRGAPQPPHLYVNGKLLRMARWPNVGWTSFQTAIETGDAPREYTELQRKDWKPLPGVFVYENPRAARWDFSNGVMMNGYWTHDWDNESRRAAAWEQRGTNRVIRFLRPGKYGTGAGTWGLKDRRFYVFDQLSELDEPGEWYLDRKKKLLYVIPPNGAFEPQDDIRLATMEKPLLECASGNVHFMGVDFFCSAGAGVVARGDGIVFKNCRFESLGATALSMSGNKCRVAGCEFVELGCAGIELEGGDRVTLTRADSIVNDCSVHDYGNFARCYACACSVRGCGVIVRSNRFYNAPHMAMRYEGNEMLIESNEIHHVARETNDAGAIYTGRDWTTAGNVIRGNFIHHLGSQEYIGENGVMAIYFDDCDCGDAILDNVFWKVPRGVMVGGGREHPIINNLFVECNLGYSIDNRGMEWKNWNEPGTSWHLEGRAEKLHYKEEPWKSRYPWLAKIMADDPQEPKNDPVERNVFVDCRRVCKLPTGEKGEKALSNLVMTANLVVRTKGAAGGCALPDSRSRVRAGFRVLDGTPEDPVDLGFVNPSEGDFRLRRDARIRRELPEFNPIQK